LPLPSDPNSISDPNNIAFSDPATGEFRLESLRSLASQETLSSLLALLAESPDPDWTLNQIERWLFKNPEIVATLEKHPQL